MKTELQQAEFGTSTSSWQALALGAAADLRPGRKRPGFEGCRHGIGPGRIPARSATKRDVVQSRRTWEPPTKPRFGLSRLGLRARGAGMLVLLPKGVAKPVKTRPVAKEVFRGRVGHITDGTAIVTLFSEDGEQMSAQWPEQDLAKESIGRGDLFELTMTDTGSAVIPSIRKVSRRPIPDALWKEIERVKAAYSGLHAEDDDGDEEV